MFDDSPAARGEGASTVAAASGQAMFVLCSDLDGTLIDVEHDHAAGGDDKLAALAEAIRSSPGRVEVWFNSSRPLPSQRQSLERVPGLPRPAFIIGAMGTEIETGEHEPLEEYGREQFGDWPRREIDEVVAGHFRLEPHPPHLQTRYKASYDVQEPRVAEQVQRELSARELPARVVVSSGKDLDVLPPAAGKASAIRWLCGHQGFPQERVVVSGDSANDLDMFRDPFRGIVVANGHEELKRLRGPRVYHAKECCAAGVLEGLRHFGVLPEGPPSGFQPRGPYSDHSTGREK